jgi:pyruvate dehydrogenase E1 component alpha subunit
MVGPRVTDVIAEATLAVQQRLKLHDLDLTMHAHPTLAESLMEAALAADGRAIHAQNRKRPAAAPAQAASPAPKENSVARSVEEKPLKTDLPEPEPPAESVDVGRLELKKKNRDELIRLYRLMFLIRRFEERAQVEYTKAKIGGYCHLNLGEEATVVGGILPLKAGDYIYTSYREHGHAIARGVDPRAVMAELFGREGGVAHGRGGSMHIFDMKHRFMGGYGIVGGHLPLAIGAGFAIKYQRAKDVVFCMFGDGATNIGAFHESLNFSKVLELPVVWYCINNQYGMGTAVERASAVQEIYKKACAYDMESVRIDGNDLLEVMRRTSEVVEKTRSDSQPRFIEAVNYRSKGHSVVDPDRYRSDEEKERWRHEDPVLRFEQQLLDAGVASKDDLEKVRAEVDKEVEEIVKFSDESPTPKPEELYRYVYAGEWETTDA